VTSLDSHRPDCVGFVERLSRQLVDRGSAGCSQADCWPPGVWSKVTSSDARRPACAGFVEHLRRQPVGGGSAGCSPADCWPPGGRSDVPGGTCFGSTEDHEPSSSHNWWRQVGRRTFSCHRSSGRRRPGGAASRRWRDTGQGDAANSADEERGFSGGGRGTGGLRKLGRHDHGQATGKLRGNSTAGGWREQCGKDRRGGDVE
jgi:hypothetical protein